MASMKTMEQTKRAIDMLSNMIVKAAEEAGPMGAPSGTIYAALNGVGVPLNVYQFLLAKLENDGRITLRNHCVIAEKS